MFYNHEVLTSRKYGVATVWLVATLGSRSSLKRINRKQILDVDVPKTCQTILDPTAPMALRLQGNLLYGVSRVYSQQCGYVLVDAQNAINSIKLLLRPVTDGAIDPVAGKARPEQLVLQEDSSFIPENYLDFHELSTGLNIGFDLLSAYNDRGSQTLTPLGPQYAQPLSSVIPGTGDLQPASFPLQDDQTMLDSGMFGIGISRDLDEPDFTFGDDGDYIPLGFDETPHRMPDEHEGRVPSKQASVGAQARGDFEEGTGAGVQIPNDNEHVNSTIYDGDLMLCDPSSSAMENNSKKFSETIESSSSTVAANLRHKPRAARILLADCTIELRNSELIDWNKNYLQNMKEATRLKSKMTTTSRAKKNAEHYVWGSGMGGFGKAIQSTKCSHPLEMYFGDPFFQLITGLGRRKRSTDKHYLDREIDDTTQEESRRVRQKTIASEGQIAYDDMEVELPREGVVALDDQPTLSGMPWNISASLPGSSAMPRREGGSFDKGLRGSRLFSASPLQGRGEVSRLDAQEFLGSQGNHSLDGDDFSLPYLSLDYPESEIPFQLSRPSRPVLSAEGTNFLVFVMDAITEKHSRIPPLCVDKSPHSLQAEVAVHEQEITFEELLHPGETTRLIACQGLMMVLGLGSKGLLVVQQSEHLGEITLRLSPQANDSL